MRNNVVTAGVIMLVVGAVMLVAGPSFVAGGLNLFQLFPFKNSILSG